MGNRKQAIATLLLGALLASLLFLGTAQAQESPSYVGKFTLPYQVRWGKTILQPGDYTLTIRSTGSPVIALIRTVDGNAVAHVMSWASSGSGNGLNALLIKEKDGQRVVHSLALADLKMVLIYDPSPMKEKVKEASEGHVNHTVPVMWAKK